MATKVTKKSFPLTNELKNHQVLVFAYSALVVAGRCLFEPGFRASLEALIGERVVRLCEEGNVALYDAVAAAIGLEK